MVNDTVDAACLDFSSVCVADISGKVRAAKLAIVVAQVRGAECRRDESIAVALARNEHLDGFMSRGAGCRADRHAE